MSLNPHTGLRGLWRNILVAEGVQEHYLTGKQTGCPICGGKDRFRFDDKEEGRWYCNHDGAGDGFTLLCELRGYSFKEALAVAKRHANVAPIVVAKREMSDGQKRARLVEVWRQRRSIDSHDCIAYFRSRGISESDLAAFYSSPSLGWHPGLPCDDVMLPCLLARYQNSGDASRRAVTIQRIWSSGEKRVMPSPTKMNGVFCPIGGQPDGVLGVAEGVITAISARIFLNADYPVWATYSAEQMIKFQPPNNVHALTIFADVDRSFTGQAAAYELARRLRVSHPGVTTQVLRPTQDDNVDLDFNDLLCRSKEA